jgi:MoaA/NifB/PqqE/SkfB family radical SAM enzyme
MTEQQTNLLNRNIAALFKSVLRISIREPRLALFFLASLMRQRRAADRRIRWESRGIHVPPFIIASITKACNLRCKGCYARAHAGTGVPEMPVERWDSLFSEVSSLGTSIALIAGGEPFIRLDVVKLAEKHSDMIFAVFTNGTMIDDDLAAFIARNRNLVPVLSVEGLSAETDGRRGTGVYSKIEKTANLLSKEGVFFGISLTVTASNLDLITSSDFIDRFIEAGARLFFFVEYIPVEEGTESLVPGDAERSRLKAALDLFGESRKAVFISFPGDEDMYGGCLAAGRGFIHINPQGGLEPCPFAPYSDTNLSQLSLKKALSSEFLRRIRDAHGSLSETSGCALWDNREWVKRTLAETVNSEPA